MRNPGPQPQQDRTSLVHRIVIGSAASLITVAALGCIGLGLCAINYLKNEDSQETCNQNYANHGYGGQLGVCKITKECVNQWQQNDLDFGLAMAYAVVTNATITTAASVFALSNSVRPNSVWPAQSNWQLWKRMVGLGITTTALAWAAMPLVANIYLMTAMQGR
ncbi:MAG: hypothetical protein KGR16_01410 [Verrucomicrobia bacterium]|nr:hypothetical protein [Verrucomicrobiota bacterium]